MTWKRSWTASVLLGGLGAGLALSGAGCGKASEKAAEQAVARSLRQAGAKDVSVDMSGDAMTVKTRDGEMQVNSGGSVALPKDFPGDVFVDPAATLRLAARNPEGFVLQFETRQTVAAAADQFDAGMKAQDWTQDAALDMGDTRSLTYKKNARQAAVIISKADAGGATVMLSVSVPQ